MGPSKNLLTTLHDTHDPFSVYFASVGLALCGVSPPLNIFAIPGWHLSVIKSDWGFKRNPRLGIDKARDGNRQNPMLNVLPNWTDVSFDEIVCFVFCLI